MKKEMYLSAIIKLVDEVRDANMADQNKQFIFNTVIEEIENIKYRLKHG